MKYFFTQKLSWYELAFSVLSFDLSSLPYRNNMYVFSILSP